MSYNPPIPGTGICVVTDRLWSLRVFYQLLNSYLGQSKYVGGVWTQDWLQLERPAEASPLASVIYRGGTEFRIYYLDANYTIQEFCYTKDKGFYQGEIGGMKAKATPASGLAAVVYGDDDGGVHLRVYYQESRTNVVAELVHDGYWRAGELRLARALGGTSLAAVTYYFQQQQQIRVYYQAADLTLREHAHSSGTWFEGSFNPGKVTARTPLSALSFGDIQLQVYWRDLDGHTVFSNNNGSWDPPSTIEAVGPGYGFCVLQWEDGKCLRFYYQDYQGYVRELYSDDAGDSWFPGKLLAQGRY